MFEIFCGGRGGKELGAKEEVANFWIGGEEGVFKQGSQRWLAYILRHNSQFMIYYFKLCETESEEDIIAISLVNFHLQVYYSLLQC